MNDHGEFDIVKYEDIELAFNDLKLKTFRQEYIEYMVMFLL